MNGWASRPHRRYNPLTGDWVLVSPHRTDRPWSGEQIAAPHDEIPHYDPHCYLCPGNVRANGEHNPAYDSVHVFDNDFPALLPDVPDAKIDDANGLIEARSERGTCRVLCFSPRHDLHLAALPRAQVTAVVDCWAEQYAELAALPYVNAVTMFENRGAMMGASNPHPHGQIWANSTVPNELSKETGAMERYLRERGECLLCAYLRAELEAGERIVFVNDAFVALVPFWAVWPFELMLLPRAHRGAMPDLTPPERDGLAGAIASVVGAYDRMFDTPFPYTMGFHQRPCDGKARDEWHLHAHYYPPLLRSATIRKYMVGYEMLSQPQRDLTAEEAARRLRDRLG